MVCGLHSSMSWRSSSCASVWASANARHMALVPATALFPGGIGRGVQKFSVAPSSPITILDTNDYFNIVVTEYPDVEVQEGAVNPQSLPGSQPRRVPA